jgi:hypothetical protein
VGQAFHWFEASAARQEFLRILRPPGWTVLIWNSRRDSTPFLAAYETILRDLAGDYVQTNEKTIEDDAIADFFGGHGGFQEAWFENIQHLNWEQLSGRVLSSSYVPLWGHPDHAEFMARLRQIYDQHQRAGRIPFEYDTRLYYGQLHRQSS